MEHFPDIPMLSDDCCISKRKWDVPVVVELRLEQTLNGAPYTGVDGTQGVES